MKLVIKKSKLIRKINGEKVTGYYGRVVTNGTKTFEEILKSSLHGSTIDYRECKAGVEMLLDSIVEDIKQGYIIDLGPIGKLYPSVTGSWCEDPDDLKLADMKGKVNFSASDEILGAAKTASLQWASAKDKDKPTTDEEAGDEEEPETPNNNTNNNQGGTEVPPDNDGGGTPTGENSEP